MSSKPVFILGGYQTDFAVKYCREGRSVTDLLADTAAGALDACGVDAERIEAAHVGNFVSELYCGQSHLGGVLAEAVPGLRGLPISRHEAACASGSMAALGAMTAIEAGRQDLVLVAGVEYMRNVDGRTGANHLAAAAWVGNEGQAAEYAWPWMFNQVLEEYDRRYGIDYRHLAEIARINFGNARRNPNAQTRGWQMDETSFAEDDQANPRVEGRLRRSDCAQITDGGAGIVLASEAGARAWAKEHDTNLESIPRILGWGHRTARISYAGKISDSCDQERMFPHVAETIRDAFRRAAVPGVEGIDGIETHDCFTISEYMAIDHFGITPPGQSWQAIEEGTVAFGGRLPVNPSGGLIGLGHPVGATGVRMLLDASKQVTGRAGEYQVPGAKRFATLNIGGSTTTTACFVVGR